MSLLLSACASSVPLEIREAPADNPTFEQVSKAPQDYRDREVRWGGGILETENRQESTRVTVLARPLGSDGRPEDTDDSPGRFIAIMPEFLDPMVYSEDRRLTVTGRLLGTETDKVGEFSYTYPVVEVRHHYLWPRETTRAYPPPYYRYPWWYYDPWYYDPWYRPWYPYWY
ncbi:MAG: Slp family lipoprotein [Gammaproteobacteria bacterium]|jgi:outer membrane lipoprotein